jgi:hypothetical protein
MEGEMRYVLVTVLVILASPVGAADLPGDPALDWVLKHYKGPLKPERAAWSIRESMRLGFCDKIETCFEDWIEAD